MQKLDGKFHGIIACDKDCEIVPPDQFVVFLAKDNAFPATLDFYRDECMRIGAGAEQLAAVDRLRTRVAMWRDNHAAECKIPDALPGECP